MSDIEDLDRKEKRKVEAAAERLEAAAARVLGETCVGQHDPPETEPMSFPDFRNHSQLRVPASMVDLGLNFAEVDSMPPSARHSLANDLDSQYSQRSFDIQSPTSLSHMASKLRSDFQDKLKEAEERIFDRISKIEDRISKMIPGSSIKMPETEISFDHAVEMQIVEDQIKSVKNKMDSLQEQLQSVHEKAVAVSVDETQHGLCRLFEDLVAEPSSISSRGSPEIFLLSPGAIEPDPAYYSQVSQASVQKDVDDLRRELNEIRSQLPDVTIKSASLSSNGLAEGAPQIKDVDTREAIHQSKLVATTCVRKELSYDEVSAAVAGAGAENGKVSEPRRRE